MISRLPFVFGAALALALLSTILISRVQTRPSLIVRTKDTSFADRWPIIKPPPPAPIIPKEIRTIPIIATPKPQPVAVTSKPVEQVVEVKRPIRTKPKRERISNDICRGKGKRYTNNKRSWRCKR